jgi:serine/threonine protein phosphatase PrpC
MVLVSDGVSSLASDGEVVDIVTSSPDPETATKRILKYIEDLGGDDNITAIVCPLPGWGKVTGDDHTKDLREYRVRQAGEYRIKLLSCVSTSHHVTRGYRTPETNVIYIPSAYNSFFLV